MATTWARKAPGLYVSDDLEIQRTTQTWGDAAHSTTTAWWISFRGVPWDAPVTLAKAKERAEQIPAIAAGEKCWGRGCGNAATGGTPRSRISLAGQGDIPTCDACHLSFTGRPRSSEPRRACYSSDCGREVTGLTPIVSVMLGGGAGFVHTCSGCHRYYTGKTR